MLQAVGNAFKIPDLRRKIIFTLAMLVIFRIIAHVPLPGADLKRLSELISQNQLLGMLDLFSGGAMETMSIALMGVYPYITATIIMQLLIPIIPRLQELSREGEAGRNKVNRITHWLTVPLAALQGYGQMAFLASQGVIPSFGFGDPQSALNTTALIASSVAATVLLVWIGELITENGIGNGVSIIIFGGIVSKLPETAGQLIGGTAASNPLGVLGFIAIGILTIAVIVLVNEGQRRIPVQYAKRIRGNRMYGGQSTHIPLRVNSAGMIPLIFAISIMIFPGTIANFFTTSDTELLRNLALFVTTWFSPTSWLYQLVYFLMVIGFTYFYTLVIFQQQNISENLQKSGGFIPGIRPGRHTSEYLNRVITRITFVGALFLGIIAILPFFVGLLTGMGNLTLSSTALLIVVGVAIDTMKQLEAQLMMRNYEGFIR